MKIKKVSLKHAFDYIICIIHRQAVFRELVEHTGLTSAIAKFLHDPAPRLQCLAAQALARVCVQSSVYACKYRMGRYKVNIFILYWLPDWI